MKRLTLLALASSAVLLTNAATITMTDGNVEYAAETPWGKMETKFMKSMANHLYTFYNVKLDGVEVNTTSSSNNIGGFNVDGWWTGGNHNDGTPNSLTTSVEISVDGKTIDSDCTMTGDVLTIKVANELYFADKLKFCDEFITYTVSGISMEVSGEHHYTYPTPKSIWVYYPMQSVFIGETEILTPGGRSRMWMPLTIANEGKEVQFTRAVAPNFCTFIEHSPNGYQATYLSRDGIGNREWVKNSDYVFIGNSWGKSYHKCIGYHDVSAGDTSTWHGVYSWFREPIVDNCRNSSQDMTFAYGAYIDGKPVTMQLGMSGEMTQTAGINEVTADNAIDFATGGQGCISVSASAPDARCYNPAGMLVHVGAGTFECSPGMYIVNDMRGNSLKLFVK